jgi:hypothetical protein
VSGRGSCLAGILLAAGLAACGSTNNSGTTTNASSQLALSQCMRSHGVADFPDPSAAGGFSISGAPGGATLTVDGTTFGGPRFESAVKTCKLFGGGTSPPLPSARQRRDAVAFAQCMRKHGVPSFPDPTFPASGGIASEVSLAGQASPAFQKAAQACGRRG